MDDKTNKKSGVITIDLNNLNIENLLNVSHTINMQIKKCIKKQLDDYSDFEKSLIKIPYVENIINKNKDLEYKMETEKKHNEEMAKELELLRNVLNSLNKKDNIELEICEKNDTDKFWLDGTSNDNTEQDKEINEIKQINLETDKIKRIDDVEFVGNGTEDDPIVIDNEEVDDEEEPENEVEDEPEVELQSFTIPCQSNISNTVTKICESSKDNNEIENNSKVNTENSEEAEAEADEEVEEAESEEEAEEEVEEAEEEAEAESEEEVEEEEADEEEAEAESEEEVEEAEEEEAEAESEADEEEEADEEAEAESEEEADEEEAEADEEVEEAESEADEEEAEESEEEEEDEDELEVSVFEIDGKEYYVSDEVNGEIFSIIKQDDEEDIGDKIGFFKNGVAFFS